MTHDSAPEENRTLTVTRIGLHISASEETRRALGCVTTQVIQVSDPAHRGHALYGVDWRRSSLTLWGDGRLRPDFGLLKTLRLIANSRSYDLEVVAGCNPFVDLPSVAQCTEEFPDIISWMSANPLGIIEYGPSVGIAHLLRGLIQAFSPQVSIAVVFGSRKHQQRTTPELTPNWIGGSLLYRSGEFTEPPRVAVGRFSDFNRGDCGLHDFDLVIVVRATDACGRYVDDCLAQPSIRCRLIGLLPERIGMSPATEGQLLATFGPERFCLPSREKRFRPIHATTLKSPQRKIDPREQMAAFLREAVWRNSTHNKFIAQTARSIATGSIPQRTHMSEATGASLFSDDHRVVFVLCDNPELAQRLPDWTVYTGQDCYLNGMSSQAQTAVSQAVATQTNDKYILTTEALRVSSLCPPDIVFDCRTAAGLPPMPRSMLQADFGTPLAIRPLLFINLTERHAKLRDASRLREWLCYERGWMPIGMSAADYRARAAAGIDQDRRQVERIRRHYDGKSLPRMVGIGRWYPQHNPGTPANGAESQLPRLSKVVHHEYLLATYSRIRDSRGPGVGVDGLSFADFSMAEIASVLRAASCALRDGSYRPHPTRAVQIPKRSGGSRELQIMTIVDRVVATALTDALQSVLDPLFQECSYGFRPTQSYETMLAQLLRDMSARDSWVLGLEDVRDAFPNVRLQPLMTHLGQVLEGLNSWASTSAKPRDEQF